MTGATCIIPARGGSRRITGKNTRVFHGKPIIGYSIETAARSKLFERIVVSTDSTYIARVAENFGATILPRPADMALNEVGTQEVMQHAVRALKLDDRQYVCCLYATAPLVRQEDLHDGLSELMWRQAIFSMSVGAEPLRDAGQWYWGRASAFANAAALIAPHTVMVPIPEQRVMDINCEQDWLDAEKMYADLYPMKVSA